MNQTVESQFWLNPIIDEIIAKYPEGEIVVSSGISPSASYHIGHFREILSTDILKWGLEQRGRSVKHIHVVDNFDPLRKRYEFLPESFEEYVGWPICLVPDPYDCHKSYAEHFFNEFVQHVHEMHIEADILFSYEDLYQTGRMIPQIERSVEKVQVIKDIFAEISNRALPDDWMPLQILSDSKSYNEWRYKGINTTTKKIQYVDVESGQEGEVNYGDGRVKLSWRLDWPARWDLLGVMVEPHGFQEHGASGGSYETGLRFAKEVFGIDGPIAGVQYGHVHLIGENTKMSSSKGNLITPSQAFEIMPPEMLRYFYARYPAKKRIDFDPGVGLFRMMDEFSSVDEAVRAGKSHQFEDAYKYAMSGISSPGMVPVRFNHLVNIYQSALGDEDLVVTMLKRTGVILTEEQLPALKRELTFVKKWLELYAPDDLKFTLLETPPVGMLSGIEKEFLESLSTAIKTEQDAVDAQWFHTLIHAQREKYDMNPSDAFKAVYKVLLGKESGPKAGWFLSILDRDWLISRLHDAS